MLAMSAVLALFPACDIADELLQVDNPEELALDQLEDPSLMEVQVNGVIGMFKSALDDPILEFGNYHTDEVLTGLNWEDYARVSQRIISYLEGPTNAIWEQTHRALRQGNDLAEQIRVWKQEIADPDVDYEEPLATALVFAGYAAVIQADHMCQTVISPVPDEPSGTVLSNAENYAVALPYLQEALSIATTEGLSDIANLARLGLARAHLGRGEWSDAATFASQVTAGFEYWLEYIDISGARNPLQNTSHGGNFNKGIHPWFTGTHPSFDGTGLQFTDNVVDPQTDPRIQHWPSDRTGHNALTPLYKLFQGLRWADYTGETIAPSSAACPTCTGTDEDDMPLIAEYDTDFLLADYTEAQHHYYEALAMQSGNDAAVLAFVNTRRAVGNQAAAVGLTGQDLIDELRRQRAKDLFMGGFRTGDLRRWTRFDPGNGPFAGGSYFPTGTHPVTQWGDYGPWTCFPIPLQEYEGNPNLAKPLDPSVPPGI
jgi:tetratricopeptide (TPR) repeat protein